MLSRIRDYFGMSQREARGFLLLLILSACFLIFPFLTRFLFPDAKPDSTAADQKKLDSLLAKMEVDKENGSEYRRVDEEKTLADQYADPSRHVVKRFAFDPNTANVAQLQELGVPKWLAERIDKYRTKGGRFRKKEDLMRIYSFPARLYQDLEPYITLEDAREKPYGSKTEQGTGNEGRNTEQYEKENSERTYTKPFISERKPALQPFDINTVDTAQLVRLKGIGSKLAGRIVKFRDALGGFVSTDQYADIFGLDSLALSELQRFGKIQSPPHKININTVSVEELDKHVYVSRRQAEIIVRYREQHGAFTSLEALKPIRILDAKTIEKLGPYLSF